MYISSKWLPKFKMAATQNVILQNVSVLFSKLEIMFDFT